MNENKHSYVRLECNVRCTMFEPGKCSVSAIHNNNNEIASIHSKAHIIVSGENISDSHHMQTYENEILCVWFLPKWNWEKLLADLIFPRNKKCHPLAWHRIRIARTIWKFQQTFDSRDNPLFSRSSPSACIRLDSRNYKFKKCRHSAQTDRRNSIIGLWWCGCVLGHARRQSDEKYRFATRDYANNMRFVCEPTVMARLDEMCRQDKVESIWCISCALYKSIVHRLPTAISFQAFRRTNGTRGTRIKSLQKSWFRCEEWINIYFLQFPPDRLFTIQSQSKRLLLLIII